MYKQARLPGHRAGDGLGVDLWACIGDREFIMLEKVILQCCEGMLRAASDQHPHIHTHLLSTQHHLGELDDFRYCGKHIIYFIFSFHFHNYASN